MDVHTHMCMYTHNTTNLCCVITHIDNYDTISIDNEINMCYIYWESIYSKYPLRYVIFLNIRGLFYKCTEFNGNIVAIFNPTITMFAKFEKIVLYYYQTSL